VRPDLYLSVLDPETADFKTSAQEFLDRADAYLIHAAAEGSAGVSPANGLSDAAWDRVSLRSLAARPSFPISPPPYVTDEVVAFVRFRLKLPSAITESNTSR